jgi:glycosyltransferase involved in cell wall biosynthesis
MRAVVMSRAYADPNTRAKLKALAGLGVTVAALVPDRWMPFGLRREQTTSWGDDGGVRTIPIRIRGSARADGDPHWSASSLRGALTEARADILQIEEDPETRAAATAARVARGMRLPYVVVAQESLPRSLGPLTRLRRSWVLGGAAGLVGVNQQAARLALRSRPSLPHRVMPQLGVALPLTPAPTPRSGLSIGFIGRLIPEKGLDLLFRACVKLVGRWTITIVGTGPAQEELEALAERLGIAGRLTWLGALPRAAVDEVWPRLDCLVAPSRTAPRWVEVTPRAPLEAMAHGIPVIVSASGALPETIGPGGAVVPEEDVEALAGVLQRFLDSPSERSQLGAAGRRRVMDEYTDSAIARKTHQFWTELVTATA